MKTIMIVDDDSANLQIADNLLSNKYNVIPVISGERALRILNKKKVDLILLDLEMPIMNGFEVLKNVKENEKTSKIPVIFITASVDEAIESECIRKGASDFLTKPFVPDVMISRIERTLELDEYRHNLEDLVKRQTERIFKMQYQVVISMANLIESRDGNTGEHVKRTGEYVRLIANEIMNNKLFNGCINVQYLENLCKAAPLHDIGKITVPDNILQKPGKLTSEEFEIMKKHTIEGGKIIKTNLSSLEDKEFIDMAYDVAMYHHEKWNGKGYPCGLKKEEIPLCARIMAIADVFDALVSERCYKQPVSVKEAFNIIKESSGEHFDPVIVNIFIELKDDVIETLNK